MTPGFYRQAIANLAAEIEDLGVRAVTDPQAVNPPCVVIDPPSLERITSGHYAILHRVHLIAPGFGNADAISNLDGLLESVFDLDPDSIEPSTFTLGSTGEAAPALTLTLERSH